MEGHGATSTRPIGSPRSVRPDRFAPQVSTRLASAAMNAIRILSLLVSAALTVLVLGAGPAVAEQLAVEDGTEEVESDAGEDEGHRIPIAETPRDRVGLLLLAALVAGGGLAWVQARRQLKGEHDQASGEFRWR